MFPVSKQKSSKSRLSQIIADNVNLRYFDRLLLRFGEPIPYPPANEIGPSKLHIYPLPILYLFGKQIQEHPRRARHLGTKAIEPTPECIKPLVKHLPIDKLLHHYDVVAIGFVPGEKSLLSQHLLPLLELGKFRAQTAESGDVRQFVVAVGEVVRGLDQRHLEGTG